MPQHYTGLELTSPGLLTRITIKTRSGHPVVKSVPVSGNT